jgi:hypothetical protein
MPPNPSELPARSPFQVWAFRIALAALVVLALVRWPASLSFSDEVGYLGQARLLLSGRISPTAADPCIVERLDGGGRVSRYPLFVPLLVAPLMAINPRTVFVLGLASLAAILWIAARIFDRWRIPTSLALLFAVHPTFILLGYTAMSDLFLSAAALGAFALAERRRRSTTLLFALLVLAKPVGALIAAGLIAGGALERWKVERALAPVLRWGLWPALGSVLGGVAAAGLNWLEWQHLGYSYDALHQHLGVPIFSTGYLAHTIPIYLLSLLVLLPGLLLLGPLGLWRRRCYGPLIVSIGLLAMMASYFFFDHGRSRLETIVLAQRLILPASTFLVLGYADVIAPLFRRTAVAQALTVVLVLVSAIEVYGIGTRLRGWQHDAHDALVAARAEVARTEDDTLGTTESAMKIALMHRGRVVLARREEVHPRVVICNVASGSYRAEAPTSCALPGYDAVGAYGTFRVLVAR